jgi:PA14 domain
MPHCAWEFAMDCVVKHFVRGLISALLVIAPVAKAQFNYVLYHGQFDLLPDFSVLTPAASGVTGSISTTVSDQSDYFAIVFTRELTVDTAATYFFQTNSDDGSKLYIDEILIVDNDGLHGATLVEGSIYLGPGTHSLKVEYFEKTGGAVLEALYRVEGNGYAPIPADGQLNGTVLGRAEVGEWGPVIQWPHIAITAANLPDGRILK